MAAYLAALNRRDLYCEIAWHATHSPSGQAMMTWVTQEISRRTDNWWYMEGPKIELESWLDLFERQKWMNGTIYDAVSGMINGAMSMIVSGSPA
ncbi:MAG: hypothetical protein KGJ90_00375 [Patescibacteria group bacterium]|nr:hypothetical protein [Patescibacteria group bacterium]